MKKNRNTKEEREEETETKKKKKKRRRKQRRKRREKRRRRKEKKNILELEGRLAELEGSKQRTCRTAEGSKEDLQNNRRLEAEGLAQGLKEDLQI